MKYIEREMKATLLKYAESFPIVTILGPRQSGKTTLAKAAFSSYGYVNLEDPEIFNFAMSDINGFFETFKTPLIIDEIQRVPQIVNKIQTIVDTSNENGMFILTGSFQQALKSSISQSLAGRTAILNLLPLSIWELENVGIERERDDLIFQGFMPRLYAQHQDVNMLYSAYFQTYIEKDVQTILNVHSKWLFEKFIRLLAGRIGQVVNFDSLANDVGVSAPTIQSWLSILESSYVIFKVEPYFQNFTKRLVKSPKIYFMDTGLLCYLLGIHDVTQVSRDPLIGNLFENMVMLEILKTHYNCGKEKNLFYFRDSKGFEIDAIVPIAERGFMPIEVKSSKTFSTDFTVNLRKICNITSQATEPTVVYSGSLEGVSNSVKFINFKNLNTIIKLKSGSSGTQSNTFVGAR